jgi:hypothetical protein
MAGNDLCRRDGRLVTVAAQPPMAADSERLPVLVLNPPDDPEFRALATRLLDEGVLLPASLQGRLREQHPYAIVRPRDLVGEPTPVWYVYRDGRWVGAGS